MSVEPEVGRTMRVITVPVNADNLAYLIYDSTAMQAWAVDPAEPDKVLAAAERAGVTIAGVLATHHHKDHSGGNAEMASTLHVPVYGGSSKVEAITNELRDRDVLELGGLKCLVLAVPFHTLDSLFFVVSCEGDATCAVFTGDSVFSMGCGRFFEGDALMCDAAFQTFRSLPPAALVFFGHEYSDANATFALTVDPENEALQEAAAAVKTLRLEGKCTAPSTVGRELAINPFLRCETAAIRRAVGGDTAVETLRLLRERKNNFR
jgi:hydroxyacylglutathione hydrolase